VTPCVLMGSGAFALPSFTALVARGSSIGIAPALIVSQPDRPAGRGRETQPTPVSAWAVASGLELIRVDDVNDGRVRGRIDELGIRTAIVIAFGQKLSPSLLDGLNAVNLHGSLLPRWRGAAPIQRSLMAGDSEVGISVIEVTDRMDAGRVLARAATRVDDGETSGELHDRLAMLGVEPLIRVVGTVAACAALSAVAGDPQDELLATRARKLGRADAWVDFRESAAKVAARINGLSPWPGVDAIIEGTPLRVLRARVASSAGVGAVAGCVMADGAVACGEGAVQLLSVQAPGGRPCAFDAYRHGRRLTVGARVCSPLAPGEGRE